MPTSGMNKIDSSVFTAWNIEEIIASIIVVSTTVP